jgi:hypothetical protein
MDVFPNIVSVMENRKRIWFTRSVFEIPNRRHPFKIIGRLIIDATNKRNHYGSFYALQYVLQKQYKQEPRLSN